MRRHLVAVAVVASALFAAGCGSQPPGSTGGYDQFGCKISCDKCPPQTLCVGSPYNPVCLIQCNLTSDCNPGQKCVVVSSDIAPSVCIGSGALTVCHPTTCQVGNECRDAMTALVPLPSAFGACGWEVVHCDSGCDAATGSCK